MAQVMDVPSAFVNALSVGALSNTVLDYYQDKVSTFRDTLTSASEIGRNFLSFCENNFAKPAIDLVRRAQSKFTNSVIVDTYKPILDVAELGLANDRMKSVILSHPEVRKLLAKDRCDAFNNSFTKIDAIDGGLFDRINKTIMNNVLQVDEEEGTLRRFSVAPDLLIEDFHRQDRYAALQTYETIGLSLDAGIDPTSPEGSRL